MTHQLLTHYHAELDYLRTAGSRFAQQYPKTANMLRFDQHGSDDPLVSRLVESFAFLTAKIAAQNEADETVLARSLIQVLYPAGLLPIPSMTTVQMVPDKQLDRCITLDKHTALETTKKIDQPCYFRTGYAVDIMPLTMQCSALKPIAECPNYITAPAHAKAFITLSVSALNKAFTYHHLPDKPLRCFINAHKQSANSVYGYLLNHQIQMQTVARKGDDIMLSSVVDKPLLPVGMTTDDLLWPSKKPAFDSCQMFSEYAAFPEKHMYVDMPGFKQSVQDCEELNCEITIFLDEWDSSYESFFHQDLFQLGCTPVVNLFKALSKPITLDHQHTDYPIQADSRLARKAIEIYSVDSLTCWQHQGRPLDCYEMYQSNYYDREGEGLFWQMQKSNAWAIGANNLEGSETSVVINAQALKGASAHVVADVLCTNRDSASKASLCQQGGEFKVQAEDQAPYRIDCLHHATPVVREPLPNKLHDLVSLLVQAHDNLFTPSQTPVNINALKVKLDTLNRSQDDSITLIIDSLLSIHCKRITRRYPYSDQLTYVQGIQIELTIDAPASQQEEHYLFMSVLNAYLQHYCPVNSFFELCVLHAKDGRRQTWPPHFQ